MGWIIYGAALLAITGIRYNDLGSASYVYYAAMIGIAASVLLDTPIHSQFLRGERRETTRQRDFMRTVDIKKKREDLQKNVDTLPENSTARKRGERMLKDMDERIRRIEEGKE